MGRGYDKMNREVSRRQMQSFSHRPLCPWKVLSPASVQPTGCSVRLHSGDGRRGLPGYMASAVNTAVSRSGVQRRLVKPASSGPQKGPLTPVSKSVASPLKDNLLKITGACLVYVSTGWSYRDCGQILPAMYHSLCGHNMKVNVHFVWECSL
jgi:hypothetical protein